MTHDYTRPSAPQKAERSEDFDWDAWNRHRTTLSLQEKALEALVAEHDAETQSYINVSDHLILEQVEADDYGGLDIHLSGGFRLQLFPSGKTGEHWRLFQPRTDNPKFGYARRKVRERMNLLNICNYWYRPCAAEREGTGQTSRRWSNAYLSISSPTDQRTRPHQSTRCKGHSRSRPQHRLNFSPLPHGQGSFRPTSGENSGPISSSR